MAKILGEVLHISKVSKKLILSAENIASIGDNVYDNKKRKIGSVFDVFGPVNSPYISVKVDDISKNWEKNTLFIETNKRKYKKRKRKR